jgi:UPF0755 protein
MPLRFFHATVSALHMHVLRWWREYVLTLAAVLIVVLGGYFFFFAAPYGFPADMTITIPEGASLGATAEELKKAGLIPNQTAFVLFVRLIGGSDRIHAGRYRFPRPQNAIIIAGRLIAADSGIPPIRITFPEGSTNTEMAALIHAQFSDLAESDFIAAGASGQGYLFPDTYVFAAGDTQDSIIVRLRSTFDKRIATIEHQIRASGHSLGDIVTMASILEAETKTPEDRRIVAGILWKRLAIGMALQVDAAPETYKTLGLPRSPIDNPGLDAVLAAAEPTKTKYLYYLTGSDGRMHYAVTFAEHQANLERYLK